MNKKLYIYALSDPRDYKPRYIGVTNNLERRSKAHLQKNGQNKEICKWVAGLKKYNLQPKMVVLQETDKDNCIRDEANCIYAGFLAGNELYNKSLRGFDKDDSFNFDDYLAKILKENFIEFLFTDNEFDYLYEVENFRKKYMKPGQRHITFEKMP